MHGFLRFCLSSVLLTLLVTGNAEAQFSFKKIGDEAEYDIERAVQFYGNPRFDRVEGLFLNFGAKLRPQSVERLQFYGDAGAGFWNDDDKQFRYTAGVRKDFFEFNRLSIGAEVFKHVASQDDWVVGQVENSLAALFFREDYKDYYGVQGFNFFVDHRLSGIHTLRFEIERRTYDALDRNIDWSVFGGTFDENPTRPDSRIVEGDEVALRFIAAFDWRDNPVFPLTGWYLEAIYEHTEEDFDTDGLFVTIKKYLQTFGNQRLVFRGMVGTRRGSLAEQHTIDLGGIGSLRGFDDKEYSGNRMAMLNANYFFGGDVLQKIPLQRVPFFGTFWTTLSLGVFVDTGWAWQTSPRNGLLDGFGQLTFDNLKTDVGLSILLLEGVFRIDIAKRTDRSRDDFRVTFRLLERL
ncbi:MAG: hypothetical protein D6743_16725 [Calditrichaeota bacterium]|nr:MAG: hypothetical protein D6743_16725 [Calditrichota bacterium]